jgi:hypothetical protein
VEEAESLVKRFFNVVGSLPPEVAAVAVLWTAAKAAGVLRPWRTSSNAVRPRREG